MILELHSQTQAAIRQICHVLELPRSSFYHAAEATATQLEDRRLGALIEGGMSAIKWLFIFIGLSILLGLAAVGFAVAWWLK